jgi:hypothetical protein
MGFRIAKNAARGRDAYFPFERAFEVADSVLNLALYLVGLST